MLRKEAIGLALTLLIPNAVLSFAAEAPELAPGSRVRVSARTVTERPLIATLTALDDTALTLRVKGRADVLVVPRSAITKVEVSLGRRARGKGALIGAGVGIAAGALVGLLHGGDDSSQLVQFSAGDYALGFAALGGGVGALVGAAVPPSERWNEVALGRVRVGLQPTRGHGGAIFASIGF